LKEPERLVVIESTSPDQYAWHWTGHMESTDFLSTVKRKYGSTRIPKPVDEKKETTFLARMSVFPVASQWGLARLIDTRSAKASPDERLISTEELIFVTQYRMKQLLESIPEVSKTGRMQEIQSRNLDAANFVLFRVEPNNRK
jgi:hypothetical protein